MGYHDQACAGTPIPDKADLTSDTRSVMGSSKWPEKYAYPPEAGLPLNPV